MLTVEPTAGMYLEWKKIYDESHNKMTPNRKSGQQVDEYFRTNYPFRLIVSNELENVVSQNIMLNDFSRKKLPNGIMPNIKTYMVDDVLVGIDLVSGFIHVECENIEKSVPIYDDLFVYRGLDMNDLNIVFLVAEYIRLTK